MRATFKDITLTVSPIITAHSLHLQCGLQRLQEALRYDYSGSQIPRKHQDPAEKWQSSTVAHWRWEFHPANKNIET